jgi:polysaccharide deacetylase family protein (PEP-CTERM system associated)
MNILQVDVEHLYCDHHINVEEWENIQEWQKYRDRTVWSTERILGILEKNKTNATFFILGCVAKRFPDLVERIEEAGHEIGSHGYWHVIASRQSPQEFEEDLKESLVVLNRISHNRIIGYRACSFSLVESTSWIIDILKSNGLRYDSSIFPFKTNIYGVPGAPVFPYRISSRNIKIESPKESFLEFPLSVYRIPLINANVPIAGGFFFRVLPYWFVKSGIKRLNKEKKPAICYIHNWELDSDQPRIEPLRAQLYHYWGLSKTEKKLKKLLNDFDFVSTREWIENEGY